MIVSRVLDQQAKEFPQLEIERIDILASPMRALKAGVRIIPTLMAGDRKLSGFLLSAEQIRKFIQGKENQT